MKIHIPADFTLDELQAFIEGERQEAIEGYYTAEEWAEHFNVHIKRMRKILKRAKERGFLDMVRVNRFALDNKTYPVPVYALKKVSNEEDEE